ncbi:MAG: hypothetical protein ACREBU_24760, partial [Nitrososphaera sp.]
LQGTSSHDSGSILILVSNIPLSLQPVPPYIRWPVIWMLFEFQRPRLDSIVTNPSSIAVLAGGPEDLYVALAAPALQRVEVKPFFAVRFFLLDVEY